MLKSGRNNSWNESDQVVDAISGHSIFPLWQKSLLFSFAYFLFAELGHFLTGLNTPFVTFWLPAGLYVAVLLLNETREWPVLALATLPANLAADLTFGTPFMVIPCFYVANTLQAVIGAWLVRRFVAVRPTLFTLKEFFGLIGFSGILSAMLGATIGAGTLKAFGLSSSFAGSWRIWLGSNAMAILIVSPFVLTWFSNPTGLRGYLKAPPKKQLEAALLVAGLTLFTWYAFIIQGGILSPHRTWLVPFLLWAGLRFGVRGATAINFLLALLVGLFFNIRFAANPLPEGMSPGNYIFMMQLALAMGTFVGLFPAIVLNERDKMLAKLRESEERFRNLAAAAFEGIVISENGRIVDGNGQFFKMFGYNEEEMIGLEILDLVAPESRTKVAEFIRLQNEEIYGHRLLRKDGSIFHGEARAKIVHIGNRALRMTAVRDITERQRTMEKIVEQAALLNETADAIIVRDLDDRILYWNKGAERMYGWAAGEAAGRQATELLHTDAAKFKQALQTLIGAGGWSGELEQSTKEGRKLTVSARLSLVRDKEGKPKSIMGINTDVTEKKKIETQFMRAQRMESLGNLAGGIAHDLNNILAPIMISIELLTDFVKNSKTATDILETIHISATRGAAIVQQVLSFARGFEGRQIEIHAGDLINDIQHIVKDTFPKNIRMQTAVAQDVRAISGDPTHLYQILLNLCVNARDAMPDGGLINITVENRMVDEPYAAMHLQSKVGPYVLINVTDTGTGIPRENLDKIFEPFFTTKEIGSGSGLGLSTLLAVIKSHGGFVNVESELGKGTTFSLYLPAQISTSAPSRKMVEEPRLPRGNGEMVLLVDDEESILRVAGRALEAFGYRVIAANDGVEALAIYEKRKNEIAVVLTDMMMPVMDGPATIQALKKLNPDVKIIAASGLNVNGKMAKAEDAGIKHFLPKPYSALALLDVLKEILNEK